MNQNNNNNSSASSFTENPCGTATDAVSDGKGASSSTENPCDAASRTVSDGSSASSFNETHSEDHCAASRDIIFLTGGTGFLGTEIAAGLIRLANDRQQETGSPLTGQAEEGKTCSKPGKIYVLVRSEDMAAAALRLKSMWLHDRKLCEKIGTQIIPVVGDFTKKNLGLDAATKKRLQKEVTLVFHAGAEVGLQKDRSELMTINRQGTARMLRFASGIRNLKRFVYISTAYVAGQRSGVILEDDPVGNSFSSLYEQSKAEAENLVRSSSLPFSVCRPGMIVGDSRTGWARNFNTIYYVLKLLLTGKMHVLPVKKDLHLNLIPVDYVADAVIKIAFSVEGAGKTFHLTCPQTLQPRAGELAEYVREWAARNLDLRLPEPQYMPVTALRKAGLFYNKKTSDRRKNYLTNLLALLPYFFGEQVFDRSNTDAVAGPAELQWRDYIDPLLSFACRKNFMQQAGRSVFEQADVRRAGRRYPVRYYDVSSDLPGGILQVSGPEVNSRIEKIVDALWSWGIRGGDKVALTGINSVDYMALDHAIGRIGAVSVPVYYTTPVDEVQILLDRSGAKWLFVGDRRIMEHIEDLKKDIRVVAFSDGLYVQKPGVLHWEQFLYEGREKAPLQHPDPDALATIRYTSGTTGEPKGVKFNFGQLAWMGEVLTNLLPWEERNRSIRYMSFLPMSHVVEGILASYAPYYMLAEVDYYFLNDFGMLAQMLPKVRPTVFFSVPRFYEKLWDQLTENKFGKAWLKMKEGPAKRAAATTLCRIILKKAGLDACRQLIVGSAPVSEALLLNFRSLGIEIYNAYGQAEAPLITINRLRDNVIPTVGTPLPETEVTTADDGELLVRGPQVCLGYYGLDTDTVRDGILKTGDLGTIHEDEHITLYGRKKEMVVTAYGKNISIPKIEERLKNIPGVSEAVLIGENRPYCTALLWTEREIPDLNARIEEMNAGLSHPEQIRRYKIIQKPLSIRRGELTPNLKVRRANVAEHLKQEIEEMYS